MDEGGALMVVEKMRVSIIAKDINGNPVSVELILLSDFSVKWLDPSKPDENPMQAP